MSTENKQNTKTWKTVGTFSNYEDADKLRNSLLADKEYDLVKVKRGAKEYRVKAWSKPRLKESKKNKKGKKNDNKKIRAGYVQE